MRVSLKPSISAHLFCDFLWTKDIMSQRADAPMIYLILVSLFLAGVHSKVIDGRLKLSSDLTEVYLGKFAFAPISDNIIRGNISVVNPKLSYYDNAPHKLAIWLFR